MKNVRIAVLILAGTVFMIPLLPYFIFGESTYFSWNDILDSNHVLYAIMGGKIPGAELKDGIYPSIMGGVPASCLPSSISVIALIYSVFEPFTAFVFNLLLIRLVALSGMYMLLKKVYPNSSETLLIGIALGFSLIPFFPFAGISVAGLPFLLLALLSIRRSQRHFLAWIYILIFPFYTNLVWVGIILLPLIGVWILYDFIVKKKWSRTLTLASFALVMCYLFTEYPVIRDTLIDPLYVSQRVEFSMASLLDPVTLPWGILSGWDQFLHAQEHSLSMHFPIIMVSVSLVLILMLLKKEKRDLAFILLVLSTGLISLLYGILLWTPLARLTESVSLFRLIDFSRFYFLQPFLWYLLFFLSLRFLFQQVKWLSILGKMSLVLQLVYLLYSSVPLQTFFRKTPLIGTVSYNSFYSVNVYSRIKSTLFPLPHQTRFACLGIYPGIAQFNGFHTVDGYLSNYPLAYKKDFRKIIEGELNKDDNLRRYFDHWGSRCYLFNQQTGKNFLVKQHKGEKYVDPELNRDALKQLNCSFILSALPIEQKNDQWLYFMGEYQDPNNPFKVFLYKVVSN